MLPNPTVQKDTKEMNKVYTTEDKKVNIQSFITGWLSSITDYIMIRVNQPLRLGVG